MLCTECRTDMGDDDQCPSCQPKEEALISDYYFLSATEEESQTFEPDHLNEDISIQESLVDEEAESDDSVPLPEASVEVNNQNEVVAEEVEPAEFDNDSAESAASDKPLSNRNVTVGASVERSLILSGDIEKLYVLDGIPLVEGKPEEEKSLTEFTHTLPVMDSLLPDFALNELEEYLAKLREERIILISCPSEELALSAVYEFLDKLGIPLEHRRMLNFETRSEEDSEISVYSTLNKRKDSGIQMALVVDALSDKSQIFIDSLFKSRVSSSAIKEDLKNNGIWLLCNVDPAYIERKSQREKSGLKFPLWKISFLRPILNLHYPSQFKTLEADILRQRSAGKWSKDEVEFYEQIAESIKRGNLPEEIQLLDKREPPPPESLFKEKDPIGNVLLYVATYFSNLSHKIFGELVTILLKSISKPQEATTDQTSNKASGNNAEMMLVKTWQEEADERRRKCSLEAVLPKDSVRVINFSDHRLKESLSSYMEKECGFYLERQLLILQQQGLLFYPSPKVAENLIRLIVDKAISQSEDYDLGWLIEIIVKLKQYANPETMATSSSQEPLFQFLERVQKNRIAFAYSRISWLIRSMLEYAELKDVVSEFLGQLMFPKRYDSCFQIIKRLRFAPNLDEFYWIKQLLERGDKETRIQTTRYLYSYVKKMEPNIYEILAILKTWLPEKERSASVSGRIALRLILDYCSDTTSRFAAKQRDTWPGRHPLFTAKDLPTANNNLDLLVRLLFHPVMKAFILKKSPNYILGRLILSWVYLLSDLQNNIVSQEVSRGESDVSFSTSSELSQQEMLNLLLNHVLAVTNNQQQIDLIKVWRQDHQRLLDQAADPLCSRSKRHELALKRRAIKQVIIYLADLQRQALYKNRLKLSKSRG